MNDMVIDYQYHLVTNADNEIKDVNTLFSLRAAGAGLDNGFSLLLPFAETNLIIDGKSDNITPDLTANNDYTILDLFESIAALTGQPNEFFNTEPDEQYNEPIEFYCELILSDPVLAENLDFSFPYNPFLRQAGGNNHEIHLMDYSPTERMNTELFMTEDDASDPATGSYYVSPLNLPWALNLPESWMYPSEKNSIVEVYFQFAAWAESGGDSFQNWYIYDENNVDVDKVYLTP
jgi:LruC domain-containing protein